ncbi:MAG: MFS transporter [Pseudomonadota bacterium]
MITDDNRRWWVAGTMGLPLITLTIDVFGVTVALPSIGRDLNTGTVTLAWVINAFMLGFASMLIVGGRLGDLLGRRKLLLAGVVLFVASSILSGLAPSGSWLIAARGIQGVAGGFVYANSLSVVANAFPSEQRHLGISLWIGIGAVGSAVGPFVGGLLTEELSWRWFFLLNVPIGAVAVIMTFLLVKESRDEEAPPKIDWFGCALSVAGLVLIVMGLQLAGNLGWSSLTVWACLVVGLAVSAAFIVFETKTRFPLIDFQLFRNRNFGSSASVGFVINFTLGALMLYLALYLQHVLKLSPLSAGLVFLGYSGMMAVISTSNAYFMNRWGARRTMATGMLLNAASFLVLAFAEPTTGLVIIVAALVLGGAGQSFAYTTATSLAMASVSEQKSGAASGAVGMIRISATTVGVAVSTAVFKAIENGELVSHIGKAGGRLTRAEARDIHVLVAGSDQAAAKLAHDVPAAAGKMSDIVNQALMAGFGGAMFLCVAASVVGLMVAFLARSRPPAGEKS